MNWDKQSVAAVVIGALILILWFMFGPSMPSQTQTPPAPSETVATAQATSAVPAVQTGSGVSVQEATAVALLPEVTIGSGKSTYHIQPFYGIVDKVVMNEDFPTNSGDGVLELKNEYPVLTGKVPEYGAFGLRSENGLLTTVEAQVLSQDSDSIQLKRKVRDLTGTEFTIVSNYEALSGYRLRVSMNFINNSNVPVMLPAMLVSAGDLQPWHKLSGDPQSQSQEVLNVEFCTGDNECDYESAASDADDFNELNGKQVRWFGAANRFFAQLFKSSELSQLHVERYAHNGEKAEYTVQTSGRLPSIVLQPNQVKEITFDYYLGPKNPKMLAAFDGEADAVMHLGWFPINSLAHIMLMILNLLYSFISSWGWSIILLTLLVRTIFFPVTMKANNSMRAMQVLAPKLKEIREKYKDEPALAQTKMAELYREHKVNPLGGCLPMLIQIPVFIALYYALGSAAELRMQSFWWIKDLTQPDTVCHIFGIAINPLIIVWSLLMFVQQRLTPTTMEPMQARVMMAMPIVMLFILYKLPAALTLYWTVSQLFSIAQMVYQNKKRKHDEAEKGKSEKPAEKPKTVRS